ncbi:MAG: hypothetical protein ACOCZQ_02140 [Nanoarchaeota archaeon]
MGRKIVDWLVKNIILPRYKNIKNPGFIIISLKSQKGKDVFIRQVLFPENLVRDIETRIEQNKCENVTELYNIGVSLGWNFAKMFSIPSIESDTRKEVENYARFTSKWNFSTWTKDTQLKELDLDNKRIEFEFDQHIVCRHNGKGYIITEGAEAGVGKYLFCDETIETVQLKCQGRNDEKCETLWATRDDLKKNNIEYKEGKVLYEIKDFSKEKKFNTIQKAKYSNKSTYNMLQSRIFNFDGNLITYKNQVFFDCAVLLYYLMELILQKDNESREIVYQLSFDYGKKIAEDENSSYIPQLLAALGWGDTLITQEDDKISVHIFYFPWCSIINEGVEFLLFRGLLSGMLSSTLHRKIDLKIPEIIEKKDYVVMKFKEQ